MTRLIGFALLDMNPNAMRLLNTVLLVATPMMKGAILSITGILALIIRFAVIVINYLPQHYEQARANRLAFCRIVGDADNALCTVTETLRHICTNHPFDALCSW